MQSTSCEEQRVIVARQGLVSKGSSSRCNVFRTASRPRATVRLRPPCTERGCPSLKFRVAKGFSCALAMKRGRPRADDVSRSGASRRRQIDGMSPETLREHRRLECARVTRSRAGGSSGPVQPEASGSASENEDVFASDEEEQQAPVAETSSCGELSFGESFYGDAERLPREQEALARETGSSMGIIDTKLWRSFLCFVLEYLVIQPAEHICTGSRVALDAARTSVGSFPREALLRAGLREKALPLMDTFGEIVPRTCIKSLCGFGQI